MDILDTYKQAWENQPKDSQKVSRNEIFTMMHARSSSIVKWIFIIGLLEFILISSSFLLLDNNQNKETYEQFKELGLENLIYYSTLLFYGVIIYFLYQFYSNYKNISSTDNTKKLIIKILKTHKTVKTYVFFNIIFNAILFTLFITLGFIQSYNQAAANDFSVHSSTKSIIIIILILFIASATIIFIIWLFYQLLYGILLKKLNRNYKELIKLEELK